MKKKSFMGIMLLIAAMVLSAGGTCLAQDTVFIDTPQSGTTRVFFGPVFSTFGSTGATAYGIIGDILGGVGSSATPFAIANSVKAADGQMNLVFPASTTANSMIYSGTTPIGSPAVISGETNAFVVAVRSQKVPVANGTGANNGLAGVTVAMIDGTTMAVNWQFGIPEAIPDGDSTSSSSYLSSVSPYFPTQLTVWTPSKNLDATGATIYGTSGTTVGGPVAFSGASVWALKNSGGFITNGTTRWPLDTSSYRGTNSNTNRLVKATLSTGGISGFITSPVISGESIFYVGYAGIGGGITIFQMDKDDLGGFTSGAQNATGGVIYEATVKPTTNAAAAGGFSERFMPTPVASGGSLFVVCHQGGVTVYDTQDLAIGGTRTAGYCGNLLLNAAALNTGVTASPVIYATNQSDPYIIMCGTSAVTAWKVSAGLKRGQAGRSWWHNFARSIGAGSQIWGTPAVANGYVFVPVINGANGTIYAFNITGTPDIAATSELNYSASYDMNFNSYSDPILVNGNLWAFSYGSGTATSAKAYKFDASALIGNNTPPYWTQFKFNAAKTGENTYTAPAVTAAAADDSGCFISKIK